MGKAPPSGLVIPAKAGIQSGLRASSNPSHTAAAKSSSTKKSSAVLASPNAPSSATGPTRKRGSLTPSAHEAERSVV